MLDRGLFPRGVHPFPSCQTSAVGGTYSHIVVCHRFDFLHLLSAKLVVLVSALFLFRDHGVTVDSNLNLSELEGNVEQDPFRSLANHKLTHDT